MLWMILAGSLVLLLFAAAYILVASYSNQRIWSVEKAKLEEITRSERKFRDLFENAVAGIVSFSLNDWAIFDANQAILKMFACESKSELQGLAAAIPPATLQMMRETLLRQNIVENLELLTSRKNGEELWVLFSARVTDTQGTVQGVVVDITERKRSEEKVKEQSALLDQTQDAIVVIDPKGNVLYWNSGAEQTYGWKSGEVLARPLNDVLYGRVDAKSYESPMEDIRQFGEWSGEQFHKCKDGKEILVESRWKIIDTKPSGGRRIMIVDSDITEKRKLQQISLRAQKAESMAVLTAGIAHDLQNILAPVSVSIHLLKDRLKDKYSLKILDAVEEPIQNGVALVRNILTYGKGVTGERVRLNVSAIVRRVVDVVKRDAKGKISIKEHLEGQKWSVVGDSTQLSQVFLNLIVNACEAMPDGGSLCVSVSDSPPDENLFEHHPSAPKGPYVVATVSDTGKGIADENLDRIFEPFFTTKGGTGGTGLGLSVVHGIVTSHRGFVLVSSAEGKGTTFRVYLPAEADAKNTMQRG
jgi:two-component system, cell cycle sensor histidine kinase and response regulator CckA